MKLALLLLIFVLAAVAQPLQTGSAKAKGICNITNTDTVTTIGLNCTGLTPEQQRLVTRVSVLLNELMASESGTVSEINTKLDACIAQGASRHLTQAQKILIDVALEPFMGESITVGIYTQIKEANDFGEEMLAALKHAGLDAVALPLPISGEKPKVGFYAAIGVNKWALANALLPAISRSGISNTPIPVPQNPQGDTLTLTVGLKP